MQCVCVLCAVLLLCICLSKIYRLCCERENARANAQNCDVYRISRIVRATATPIARLPASLCLHVCVYKLHSAKCTFDNRIVGWRMPCRSATAAISMCKMNIHHLIFIHNSFGRCSRHSSSNNSSSSGGGVGDGWNCYRTAVTGFSVRTCLIILIKCCLCAHTTTTLHYYLPHIARCNSMHSAGTGTWHKMCMRL